MQATNILLQQEFKDLNGLQSTLNVPHFQEKLQKWNLDKHMQNIGGTSAQIHFNGYNHWIVSFRGHNGSIHILDSLKSSRTLNNYVKIQIAQIYGCVSSNELLIHLPIIQHTNSSDCGVFAIAYLTDLCFNNFEFNANTRYKIPDMRSHLLNCLEEKKMSPFPRIVRMPKMPDCIDNLTRCTNKDCLIKMVPSK